MILGIDPIYLILLLFIGIAALVASMFLVMFSMLRELRNQSHELRVIKYALQRSESFYTANMGKLWTLSGHYDRVYAHEQAASTHNDVTQVSPIVTPRELYTSETEPIRTDGLSEQFGGVGSLATSGGL